MKASRTFFFFFCKERILERIERGRETEVREPMRSIRHQDPQK